MSVNTTLRVVFVQAAALFCLTVGACSAAPANPLIGTWIAEPGGYVDRDGFEYCKVTPKMVFTATTQTMFTATAQGTTKVIYLVAGPAVYVSSTPGFAGAPKYAILGPDEIQAESLGSCKYRRAR